MSTYLDRIACVYDLCERLWSSVLPLDILIVNFCKKPAHPARGGRNLNNGRAAGKSSENPGIQWLPAFIIWPWSPVTVFQLPGCKLPSPGSTSPDDLSGCSTLYFSECHQRENKWQQFSINCICAKLSSILAESRTSSCISSAASAASKFPDPWTPIPIPPSIGSFTAGVAKLH